MDSDQCPISESEVDRGGKIVWSYEIQRSGPRKPYQTLRLASAKTLISLMDPGELIEVTPDRQVVRSIGGAGGQIRMGWTAGFNVMPNGDVTC